MTAVSSSNNYETHTVISKGFTIRVTNVTPVLSQISEDAIKKDINNSLYSVFEKYHTA